VGANDSHRISPWLPRGVTLGILLEVGPDNLDEIFSSLFGSLILSRHVVADVIFHQLSHQTVNGAAGRGETLKQIGAGGVFIEAAKNRFELANYLFCPVNEVESITGKLWHFIPLLPYGGMVLKKRLSGRRYWRVNNLVEALLQRPNHNLRHRNLTYLWAGKT